MARKNDSVVADICLYGSSLGAGYIARAANGAMFGDGDPAVGRSLNDALWLACLDLRDAGVVGAAMVYAPGGELSAKCDIAHPPYYGSLNWGPADMLVISVADVVAAAENG
jgi:hypothetical protein